MTTRKESRAVRLFVYSLVALLFTSWLWLGYAIVTTAGQCRNNVSPVDDGLQQHLKDWRPDIRHCHADGVDLWDCIRQPGMYREDI